MHVADEEVPSRGEALGELRVDELVDHDPRGDDASRQPVTEDGREDDERGQPQPGRNARQRARRTRRRGLGPAVASEAELVELRGERRAGVDPDLGGGLGDLVDDGVGDDRPAGGFLERRRVPLGDLVDAVLPLREGARRVAHCVLRRLARRE